MPSLDVAETFREAVRQLRHERPDLQLEDGFEFKFYKTHTFTLRRTAFFELALNYPFKFAVCAIDKTRGQWRNSPAKEQHWAAATHLAVSLRSILHEAETACPEHPLREPICVDDNQDKKFLETVKIAFQGLRSKLHPDVPMASPPRFRASKPDPVMHLVDMVCGASGAMIDGNSEWYDLVKSRCVDLVRLP